MGLWSGIAALAVVGLLRRVLPAIFTADEEVGGVARVHREWREWKFVRRTARNWSEPSLTVGARAEGGGKNFRGVPGIYRNVFYVPIV